MLSLEFENIQAMAAVFLDKDSSKDNQLQKVAVSKDTQLKSVSGEDAVDTTSNPNNKSSQKVHD